MEFIKVYDNNKILLAICLPYLTYILQPLNIYMFKPLLFTYLAELADFIDRC